MDGNNLNGANPGPFDHSLDPAAMEIPGTAAEGRVRKKSTRRQGENGVLINGSEPSSHLKWNAAENLPSATNRRLSVRDHKVPLGPRPVDATPQKKSFTAQPSSISQVNQAKGSSAKSTLLLRHSSVNKSANFNLHTGDPGQEINSDQAVSFDFLPQVNFDDFHTSLLSAEPTLDDFPIPGKSEHVLSQYSKPRPIRNKTASEDKLSRPAIPGASESRIGRSSSFLTRHTSNAGSNSQSSVKPDLTHATSTATATRNRRQSHFQQNAPSSSILSSPRKSMGPGVLDTNFLNQARPRERSDLTSRIPSGNATDSSQFSFLQEKPTFSNVGQSQENHQGFLATSRSAKTKSLQAAPRLGPDYFAMQSAPIEPDWPSAMGAGRSPGRSIEVEPTTPSSNKRLSVMPGHASGLGARTISPTDARRFKRMSVMPNPPPMPQTPSTPQPEILSPISRSTPQSPLLPPLRKSITPSSARTTPDHNRKSYSSGISNSSISSYNSVRTSLGAGRIPHLPQSLSTSRLPTPKSRVETSTGAEEEVPPVPAIPKAYESPKGEFDVQFFSTFRPGIPQDNRSGSASTGEYASARGSDTGTPLSINEGSGHVDRSTTRPEMQVDAKGTTLRTNNNNTHVGNRRILEPIRLPPLTLLPLSTPTAAKIAALHNGTNSAEHGLVTPPPPRGANKTPSTPMTASKASFASKYHYPEGGQIPASAQLRSSSSHYALRSEPSGYRELGGFDASLPVSGDQRLLSNAISPFVSSSLPKTSGEYVRMGSKISGEFKRGSNLDSEGKSSKLKGPRAQTSASAKSHPANDPNFPTSPQDTESSSFGHTIRRKLSLTRKRSASKAQSHTEAEPEPEMPPQPPKHDGMPPPKLPASASWTNSWLPPSSPNQKPNYFHSKRKSSIGNVPINQKHIPGDVSAVIRAPTKGSMPSVDSLPIPASPQVSVPTLISTQRPVATSGTTKSSKFLGVDIHLDRDDLYAEEEMRKLAVRRKDTESAAREVDELRRRATPKDRVSPTQALRTARLNAYERAEITDYNDIYFCGTQNAQKFAGETNADAANFGYDDDRGDYHIINGDHLAYRYEIVDILGKGSFGQVVRCADHKTGGLVAIKIIRNKKRFHQQALVEVNILQKLREWDPHDKYSMVSFSQSFYFRGHLCISTELLGMNLYEFIKIHEFRGFSLKLIRRFTKQMLNSLILLKGHKVIHCDLKPENILLTHPAHSEIKVIDFGSSCHENEKVYTYIQSRFYRSPEVILGTTYGMPIDMWSLGCILAELLTGYPIFPGENEQEQLACIMEVFGPPEKHLIEKSTRKKLFFDSLGKPRLTVSSKGKRRRPSSRSLQQALKCEDEAFIDFVARCLRWDPDRRIKPDEAIHHEFISGIKSATNRSSRAGASSAAPSPMKRYNSIQTAPSSATRPLPDPPTTSFKNGVAVKGSQQNNASPSKAPPKRHSTMTNSQSNVGVKRASNGAALSSAAAGSSMSSNLPRLGGGSQGMPRMASGRNDLAAVAAAAATTKSR